MATANQYTTIGSLPIDDKVVETGTLTISLKSIIISTILLVVLAVMLWYRGKYVDRVFAPTILIGGIALIAMYCQLTATHEMAAMKTSFVLLLLMLLVYAITVGYTSWVQKKNLILPIIATVVIAALIPIYLTTSGGGKALLAACIIIILALTAQFIAVYPNTATMLIGMVIALVLIALLVVPTSHFISIPIALVVIGFAVYLAGLAS